MSDPDLDLCIDRFYRLFGGNDSATRPQRESISRIESELGFKIPLDFIEFAERCRAYTSWFASIGVDYDDPFHILRINQQYRSTEYGGLPHDLVVINHGYDGDLNCYDLSNIDAEGRISICYCEIEERLNSVFEDKRLHQGYTICDYLAPSLDFWESNRRRNENHGA